MRGRKELLAVGSSSSSQQHMTSEDACSETVDVRSD